MKNRYEKIKMWLNIVVGVCIVLTMSSNIAKAFVTKSMEVRTMAIGAVLSGVLAFILLISNFLTEIYYKKILKIYEKQNKKPLDN